MSYTLQKSTLNHEKVFNYSGLSSVTFNNELYVFYSTQGDYASGYIVHNRVENEWRTGIFRAQGATNMFIAKYTNPVAVVWRKTLYVFFNGFGNNGTWWTSSTNGRDWALAQSVSASANVSDTFYQYTSPAAAVFHDVLYVAWNAMAPGMMRYSTLSSPSGKWAKTDYINAWGLCIRRQTSAVMTIFNNQLYLFYNGASEDGTWMTTLSNLNVKWSDVTPVTKPMPGNFLDYTSPAVCVSASGAQLTLFWNGCADDGLWYSKTIDGKHWVPQISLAKTIGGQSVMEKGSPCATVYYGTPYVFWPGANETIWYSQGLTLLVNPSECGPILNALSKGYDFTMVVQDPKSITRVFGSFQSGALPLPSTTSSLSERIPDQILTHTPGTSQMPTFGGDDDHPEDENAPPAGTQVNIAPPTNQNGTIFESTMVTGSVLCGINQGFTCEAKLGGDYVHMRHSGQ